MVRLKRLTFAFSRKIEPVVPLDLLWFLLFPLALVRALREVRGGAANLPVRRLPAGPADRQPSGADRLRFYLSANLRRPVLAWADRMGEPRWHERFTVVGEERLQAALSGPVIVATLHARGTLVLNVWVRAGRAPVASVADDPGFITNATLRRRAALGAGDDRPVVFLPGSGREMARFLTPGRILMLAVDQPRGHLAHGTWNGLQLTVATGAFRLARRSGATILPVIAMDTGRWRWRIVVGEAIPARLIADRRYTEAAAWLAGQLLPSILP